jgi:hypothetical protein
MKQSFIAVLLIPVLILDAAIHSYYWLKRLLILGNGGEFWE